MGRFFDTTLHRPVADHHEEYMVERFELEAQQGELARLTADLAANLGRDQAPSEPALARIARTLDEYEADEQVRTGFWNTLAQQFPNHAYILACHGDALLYAGQELDAMEKFLAAFAITPTLTETFDDAANLAHSLGGSAWLEYQLAELRAALALAEAASSTEERNTQDGHDNDGNQEDDGDDDDGEDDDRRDDGEDDDGEDDDGDDGELDVRERYSELLDEYRGDPEALAAIRAIGHRIAELEEAGVLPRSLVRRGDWRR